MQSDPSEKVWETPVTDTLSGTPGSITYGHPAGLEIKEWYPIDKTTWPMLILLSMITFGIWTFYWYYTQLKGLRCLSPGNQIQERLLVYTLLFSIGAFVIDILGVVIWITTGDMLLGAGIRIFAGVVGILGALFIIILAFQIKAALEEIIGKPLSGIWTFIFRELYLAKVINDYNIGDDPGKPAWYGNH